MFTFIQEDRPLSETSQPPADGGEGVGTKSPRNPAERLPDWRTTLPLAQSCPRCGARTRSGRPCQSPAMKNRRRCRLHGGLSTGPRTVEGLARIRAARTTHGMRTAEMEQMRALVRELRAEAKRLVELV
jgi:ribosomal protein L32